MFCINASEGVFDFKESIKLKTVGSIWKSLTRWIQLSNVAKFIKFRIYLK